jgi:hypothetical protein
MQKESQKARLHHFCRLEKMDIASALGGASATGKQRVLESRYHEKVLQDLAKKNKKCADCLSPSPSFANLSLGTFVCLDCSGLLREFGFRTKGIGLSSFTPQEVQMLDLSGGNKRLNDVYLGKHPDGERATPGWGNPEEMKRFLAKKYRDKQWYDALAAAKPAEPVRGRADSSSSSPGLESPSQTGRKRLGSKDGLGRGANGLMSGGESHRSFLAATHARAAAQRQETQRSNSSGDEEEAAKTDEDDDGLDSSEGEGSTLDPAERERRQREKLRKKLADFYRVHNPEKLDSIELFIEWVLYHGLGAFNKKLREKYGTDIPADRKNDLKARRDRQKAKELRERLEKRPLKPEILQQAAQLQALEEAAQAMALQDLASRKRASSTNPFDDFDSSASSPAPAEAPAVGRNPFEELMFL